MSIGQITIADAAKGTWRSLWKGALWVGLMMLAAYAIGVEWNIRVMFLCVTSSFLDFMIYRTVPVRHVGRQNNGEAG